jgi:hypothetical protein
MLTVLEKGVARAEELLTNEGRTIGGRIESTENVE